MTLACLGAATAAWAQDAPASGGTPVPQRVEITGSRLKQIDAESATPVEVIRREDITRTGATSVREALDTLTMISTNGNTINDVNGSGTFAPGASQASLRNLGAQSTLLLLNGRRISIYPLPNFQETFSNLDSIPLDAVDRIEILKVGGSAVYGSDAIAGVINIITRRSYQGLEVGLTDQASLETGEFREHSAKIAGGLGDYDKDGWNLFGNVEFFHRAPVMWRNILPQVNQNYAGLSPSYGTSSTFSSPGNLDFQAIPGCSGTSSVNAAGTCMYDRYSRFEAVPKSTRVNGMLSGDYKISDHADWHSEMLLSSIRAQYQSAYTIYGPDNGDVKWLNVNTGLQNNFYERGLPLTNPLNTTGEDEDNNNFRTRFTDSGGSEETNTTSYRFLTGLKGDWKGWDFDTAIGVMGSHTVDRSRGQFSYSGFLKEVGDPGHVVTDPNDPNFGSLTPVSADFFNVPGGYVLGGPNSADVLNTLFPQYGFNGTYRQYFVDGSITGDIAQLPAGPLGLVLGAEMRHETMVLTPTQNLVDADIVGFAQSQSDGSRSFGAVYTELGIPILKNLKATVAGRVDKFKGIGAHFSPRANLEYRPLDVLMLRGTVETGFRAPNLQESAQSSKSAYDGASDPKRCPAAQKVANDYRALAESDPDNAAFYLSSADIVLGNECTGSVNIIALNNPNLQPEKSLSKSLGAVLQVTKHWSVQSDWWAITRKNEINLKSVQDLLNAESSNTDVISRDPLDPTGTIDPSFTGDQIAQYGVTAGPLASIKLQYGNLFETRTSGFDFGVSGDIDLPIGKLSTTLQGTFTKNYQVYSPTRNTTGGWGDNLSSRYGYPAWVENLVTSLQVGDFTHSVRWSHQSGTLLQQDFDDTNWTPEACQDPDQQGLTDAQCHVHAYNRIDYAMEYTGIKNLTVGGNLLNVFKKRPPVDARGFLESGGGIIPINNEDAQGRMLKLYVTYKFK